MSRYLQAADWVISDDSRFNGSAACFEFAVDGVHGAMEWQDAPHLSSYNAHLYRRCGCPSVRARANNDAERMRGVLPPDFREQPSTHPDRVRFVVCQQWPESRAEEAAEILRDHGIVVECLPYLPKSQWTLQPPQWEPGLKKWLADWAFKGCEQQYRLSRQSWLDAHKDTTGLRTGWMPNQQRIQELLNTSWGVDLQGAIYITADYPGHGLHHTGRYAARTHRLTEYISMGMPLAINYDPYSAWMKPDVDYVRLREPSDILKLRDIDPAPFAVRSRWLWQNVFGPEAWGRLLLDLVARANY